VWGSHECAARHEHRVLRVIASVAIFTVHLPYGFSSIKLEAVTAAGAHFGQPGYETDLLYLAALCALVLGGSGTTGHRSVPDSESRSQFLASHRAVRWSSKTCRPIDRISFETRDDGRLLISDRHPFVKSQWRKCYRAGPARPNVNVTTVAATASGNVIGNL